MGAHHGLIMPGTRKLYVGSTEGRLFIIDLDAWAIDKVLNVGLGVGHVTPFIARNPALANNKAVTINHKAGSVSMLDITEGAEAVNATVTVDTVPPGSQNSIGHTSWFNRDGSKFYFIGARKCIFYELDMDTNTISRQLLLTANEYDEYIPQGTAWDTQSQIAYPYNQAEVM